MASKNKCYKTHVQNLKRFPINNICLFFSHRELIAKSIKFEIENQKKNSRL